jgi:rRNA maturation endonuclease Nob1
MIYTCDKCLYTFSKKAKPEVCPDCGKPAVREATRKEKEEYKRNRKEAWETFQQKPLINH